MNDNDDKGRLNDDINFSAPGGDFQSVLDDDMVPFEQVGRFFFFFRYHLLLPKKESVSW